MLSPHATRDVCVEISANTFRWRRFERYSIELTYRLDPKLAFDDEDLEPHTTCAHTSVGDEGGVADALRDAPPLEVRSKNSIEIVAFEGR